MHLLFLSRVIVGEELSEDEIENLETIANECVLYGGKAVFEARTILGIDIKDTCIEEGRRMAGGSFLSQYKKSDDKSYVALQPNPAHNVITVLYDRQSIITIMDNIGRKVKDVLLPAEQSSVNIDVKELAKGVYIYSVKSLAGKIKTGKFVIE